MRSGSEKARRARRAGLLVVALLVVAGAWILVPDPQGAAAVDDERAVASPERDERYVPLTADDAPSSDLVAAVTSVSSRVAVAARAPLEIDLRAPGTSAKPARRVDSGKLTLRAVDVATREPLDHVRARAANADRIADRSTSPGTKQVTLTLSPDAYTPLVLVPGYEPAELGAVRIVDGAEVELTAEMRRGSASIAGVVIGLGAASHAELSGAGRCPCARCAKSDTAEHATATVGVAAWTRRDPCAHCGFAADFTRAPVGPTGSFMFRDLASGTYALRLADERGHSDGVPLLVVLLDGQRVQVEMPAPVLRDVLVNLIDVDRVSLADGWSARMRAASNPADAALVALETDVVVGPILWQFGVLDGTESFGHGEFWTPAPAGISVGRGASFGGRKLGTGRRAVDDRSRNPGEDLRPKAMTPKFPEVVLESSVREDGLVWIAGVPTYELTIRLTCEPFLGIVTVPESIGTTVVRAQLERTTDPSVDDANAPATFRALDAGRYR